MKTIFLFYLIITNALMIQCYAAYPHVKESSETFNIKITDAPIFYSHEIKSIDSEVRYWLICYSGSDSALDELSSRTGINFVAPFACRLSLENEPFSEFSLLAENADIAYWHSRGLFSFSEISSPCDSYPEYGNVRNFRLRGFMLTLTVNKVHQSENDRGFLLNVNVKSDKFSLTDRAEPISVPPLVTVDGICQLPK